MEQIHKIKFSEDDPAVFIFNKLIEYYQQGIKACIENHEEINNLDMDILFEYFEIYLKREWTFEENIHLSNRIKKEGLINKFQLIYNYWASRGSKLVDPIFKDKWNELTLHIYQEYELEGLYLIKEIVKIISLLKENDYNEVKEIYEEIDNKHLAECLILVFIADSNTFKKIINTDPEELKKNKKR